MPSRAASVQHIAVARAPGRWLRRGGPPGQHPQHLAGGGRGAGRQVGERAQHRPPVGRRGGALHLGGQHGDRPVPVVALADQSRLPGHRQPCGGELLQRCAVAAPATRRTSGSAAARGGDRAAARGGGSAPRPADRSTSPASPAASATSSSSARQLLVDAGGTGQPAQLPHTQPTRTQHRRRFGARAPRAAPPSCRTVSIACPAPAESAASGRAPGGHLRWSWPQRSQRAAVTAQQQSQFAGQLHRLVPGVVTGRGGAGHRRRGQRDRHQQVAGDQPPHRGAGRRAAGRVGGPGPPRPGRRRRQRPRRRAADRRARREPVEHRRGPGAGPTAACGVAGPGPRTGPRPPGPAAPPAGPDRRGMASRPRRHRPPPAEPRPGP